MRLSERQKALVFAVALIAGVASLYGYLQGTMARPAPTGGTVVASLVVEGPGWTIAYGNATVPNATAFAILAQAGRALGFDVRSIAYVSPPGVFVTGINGTMNGQGGSFWQYWINGAFGTVASDRAPLHTGDLVLWRFAPSQGA